MKFIFSIIIKLSVFIGALLPSNPKFSYVFYLLKQGFLTGRYKSRFKKFGKGSLISHNVELIRSKFIEVGSNTEFCPYVILEMNKIGNDEPILKIGDNCQFGEFTHISTCNEVIIGNRVLTGRFVLITDNSHGNTYRKTLSIPPRERNIFSKGKVVVEDDVWIGDKVTILPGITVGHNSVIAANTVVTKNIPPFSVVYGTNNIIQK